MTTARRAWRPLVLGLLLALFTVPGCSPDAQGEVEGKVLFRGEKVSSGSVTFRCADGKTVSTAIRDGVYRINKVAVGEAKIAVVSHTRAPVGLLKPSGPDARNALPDKPAEKPVDLPKRYRQPETSGLTYLVKPGTQTHEIELKP